jgi:hypothetical protein
MQTIWYLVGGLVMLVLGWWLLSGQAPSLNQDQSVTTPEEVTPSPQTDAEVEGGTSSAATATPARIDDLIVVNTPLPGSVITSPVTISGEARGPWFFEATFPVVIVDWDGRIIGEGFAEAEGEWMTTDFVPFTGTITFEADPEAYSASGSIIMQKANPSGLPQHDNALEFPVMLETVE